MLMVAAAPAVPVALKLVLSEPAVAVSVLLPAVVASVQLPTVATPEALVVAGLPVTLPLPDATEKVTLTPETGLPCVSVIVTDGGVETAVPTVAVCPSPAALLMFAAAPAVPVALKLVLSAPAEAVSVLAPAVVARVQLPTVAMPEAFVVAGLPVTLPLPEVAKVTLTPATGLPWVSVIVTDGGVETAVPAVAVCPSPADFAMFAAAPAVPVALKLVFSAPAEAVSVLAPAVLPSVQLPAVATPEALVVWVPPVTLPPPDATEKVTLTPETGLPCVSVIVTAGAVETAVPTVAVCPSPADLLMFAAAPAVPVALKVTLSEPAVAVSVLAPAVLPNVQLPAVATPEALVVCEAPVTLPPPDATEKVTLTPATGLPCVSVIVTDGGVETAVPTVALCPSPADFAMFAAAPAVPVALKVTLSEPAVAVSVLAPAVLPSVQLPTVATPKALVVAGLPVMLPLPEAENVTLTPATGLPCVSVIVTAGAVETAVPAVAVCPSPAVLLMFAAAPAVMSKPLLVAPVRLPEPAVRV
ncbi:MAG TPA: hypothetical protein VHG28_18660 [Longimicrobiaceae bacterium]|nr:hypothetical protein [Longimicrobiaceae bacterium]